MWADPNLNEFYGRVSRIERLHRKGYGFEAAGTLGRSATYRRQRSFGRMLRSLFVVVAMGFALKGAIHFYVGADTYDHRVGQLATGTGFDPLAAALMSADPVTRLFSSFLGEVFPG
jgi:ABC-type uncharacterized transport system permease subunit